MSEQPPPRRRFQFRLRTLLIGVTLLAVPLGYVGWQAKIVRARRARLEALELPLFSGSSVAHVQVDGDPSKSPSWLRIALGDFELKELEVLRTASSAELDQIHRLFPEANIYYDSFRPMPRK